MFHKKTLLVPGLTLAAALAACAPGPKVDTGQYWQRASVSEAIYAQGPKAQQMLNRDISHCVVTLRELEGLGSVKDAIPTDSDGRLLNPDEEELKKWDNPERDGMLLAEHGDYVDFENCMISKGWERVKYVPYDVADTARRTWYEAHVDYGMDPREKKEAAHREASDRQVERSLLNE